MASRNGVPLPRDHQASRVAPSANRACDLPPTTTARQKSFSLPDYAKTHSNGESPVMSGIEIVPRRTAAEKSGKPSKGGRFRFFWKSKDKDRCRNEESDSSFSSLSSSPPRDSPLPPPRSGSLNLSRENGKCEHDSVDGFPSLVCATNAQSGGRLTQSSRDLRERKGHGALSRFDLFASCKRSPSLMDSLGMLVRKGRKEALKARVEAQREQQRDDSSSEDEEQWQRLKRFHSDEALHTTGGLIATSRDKRLVNARTERYYKRKTRDDDWDRSLRGSSVGSNVGSRSVSPSPRSWTSQNQNGIHGGRCPSRPATAPLSIHVGKLPTATARHFGGIGELDATVINGCLPIRTTSVGASAARAPTPPPRASKYLNVIESARGQRPQSYSFENFAIPPKMPPKGLRRNDGEVAVQPPDDIECPVNGGLQSLSFTASSSVVYNHNRASLLLSPTEARNSDSSVHVSDSQMSNNRKLPRKDSVRPEDLSGQPLKRTEQRNVNGGSMMWPVTCEHTMDGHSVATKPPPLPARHGDAVATDFGSSRGSHDDGLTQKINLGIRPMSLVVDSSGVGGSSVKFGCGTPLRSVGLRSASPPAPPARKHFRQTQSTDLESIGQRLDKMTRTTTKGTAADNLENALLELEKIYESMKNDDGADTHDEAVRDNRPRRRFTSNPPSKTSSLIGSCDSLANGGGDVDVGDEKPKCVSERKLLLPSSLSPSLSIDNLHVTKNGPASEPDTVLDDLAFRNTRDANLQKVVDPQPPFGIPLGPVSQAAPSDYLHAKAKDLSRPKMRRRFTPDVVQDDLAYRNLRKDKGYGGGVGRPNFEELDSIVNTDLHETAVDRRKIRASRSLSANIGHMMKCRGEAPTLQSGPTLRHTRQCETAEKSQSLTDLSQILDEMTMECCENSAKPGIAGPKQKTLEMAPPSAKGLGKYKRHSLAANFMGSGAYQRRHLSDNSASSTDTLTEQRAPCSTRADGDTPVCGDIWQVRVTLGETEDAIKDCNQPMKMGSKPASSRHLLKPIPIKKTPCENERNSQPTQRHGCFLRSVESAANNANMMGLPIDEGQLDDLLTSLAQGADACGDRRATDTARTDDGSFPTVVTNSHNGEMSVRLLLPGLRPSAVKAVQSADESGKSRVLAQANSESPVPPWSFKSNPSATSGTCSNVSRVRDKAQMFSTRAQNNVSAPGSNVSSGPAAPIGRFFPDRISSVVGTKNSAFDSTVRRASGNLTERPPARRMPSNGAQEDVNNVFNGDRIAKYKEERRKQLASQFGNWSSGEDCGGSGPVIADQPSYMRYSRRYKKTSLVDGDSEKLPTAASYKTDADIAASSGLGPASVDRDVTQFPKLTEGRSSFRESPNKISDGNLSPVEGAFRSNRASRLRALANGSAVSSCPSSPTAAELGRQGSFRNRVQIVGTDLSCRTPVSSSSEAPACRVVADALMYAATESESGETMSDATRHRLKDKSLKRKSNLNRMGTVDSTPAASESGGDETPRRHRRSRQLGHETGRSPSQDSAVYSDSLRSIEIVRTAQVRLASQSPNSVSETKEALGSSCGSGPPQVVTKRRVQSTNFDGDTSNFDRDRSGSLKESRRTTLKRPEIPKIFQRYGVSSAIQTNDVGHPVNKDTTDTIVSRARSLHVGSGQNAAPEKDKDESISETLKELTQLVKDTTAQVDCLTNAALRVESSASTLRNRGEMGSRHSKDYSVSSKPRSLDDCDPARVCNTEMPSPTKVTSEVAMPVEGDVPGNRNNIRRTGSQYDPDGNWQLSRPLTKSYSVGHGDSVIHSGRVAVSYYGGKDLSHRLDSYQHDRFSDNLKAVNNGTRADGWVGSVGVRCQAGDVLGIGSTSKHRVQHCSRRASGSDCSNLSEYVAVSSTGMTGERCVSPLLCPSSILKKKCVDELEAPTRSILKFKEEEKLVEGRPPIPHSILKRGSFDEGIRSHSPEKSSIMRKWGSSEGESENRCSSPEVLSSILRRRSSEEPSDCFSTERHSILRRRSTADENCESPTVSISRSPEPHSILKKQSSIDALEMTSYAEPRPILKKKFSTEEFECDPKPILKKKSSTEDELEEKLKPILKSRRRSGQDELPFDSIPSLSPSPVPASSDDFRPFLRARAFSSTVSRLHNVDRVSEDGLLPPPSPVPRTPSHSRHTTTSSEDEFVSLPNSPVSWKPLTNSALDAGNFGRPSALPSSGNGNFDGVDVDSGCSLSSINGRDLPKSPDLIAMPPKDDSDANRNLGNVFTDALPDVKAWSGTNVNSILEVGVAFARNSSVLSSGIVDDLALLNVADGKRLLSLKRREREPSRYRTQPVTFGELHGTDNLDSVQSFRHFGSSKDLVSKYENWSSSNSHKDKDIDNKSEARAIVTKGDVSGSDDDVIHLSVAAKASLFMQKQSQLKRLPEPQRSVNSRRYLQRSQTQPVTMEELQEATKIAEDGVCNNSDKEGKNEDSVEVRADKETSESEEDPSKLSLAERVRLFNQKMVEERLPTRKMSNGTEKNSESTSAAGPSRRKRVISTRFCTQPVTTYEVEEASRISPLAASLMRPVEPNVLLALPDQTSREMNRKHGEETVSQSLKTLVALKSSASVTCIVEEPKDEDGLQDSKPRGILKKKENSPSNTSNNTDTSHKSLESRPATKSSSASAAQKSVSCCELVTKPIVCAGPQPTTPSSSSSSSDDEDETEGITISMRADASPTLTKAKAAGVECGSTDDDSTSVTSGSGSGREPRRCIKNEAVLRRRNASLRKIEERKDSSLELQHSQSLTINSSSTFSGKSTFVSASTASTAIEKNVKTAQRSNTQPLLGSAMNKEEGDGVVEEVHGSIRDRLAALQKSQDKDWKRRLERIKNVDIVDGNENGYFDVENLRLSGGEESSKIMSRVSLLESSQQEWRKRVEEKDAVKFTVAGKLVQAGKVSTPPPSPSAVVQENSERKKRLPKPVRFQSKTANLLDLTKTNVTVPSLPPRVPSILRSKSMPMQHGLKDLDSSGDERVVEKVSVPKLDDEEFSSFFQSANMERLKSQTLEVEDAVFNQITSESRQLLIHKRTVQVARRHVASRNPLKALATRSDLQEEYFEVKTGFAEKELRRLKVEQLAKHSDLATSALAGLASTEDFTSVNLRRNSSITSLPFSPYKDLMLLHVKGRRHVQTRLVLPKTSSLNKGDNFILVTPSDVYNWVGEFSNVIERAKGAEIASIIQSRKELGCKGASEVATFEEEKPSGNRVKRRDFFQHLGGEDEITEPTNSEEDELYETGIISTNKVYNVEENELVPFDQYWGGLPRVEMLDSNKVLVFDFGSEMYVWQGKLASTDLRRRAIRLARELWDEGYDYAECDVNPMNPLHQQLVLASGKQRPSWALFGKVNQHMETVLFREKFLDWPDMERVIKVRRQDSIRSEGSIDLQPCDASQMFETRPAEPNLILEGSHLGRGLFYWDEEERRHCDVSTLGIKVWHVLEYNHSILPLESWGQFHSEDTYVVRWQYRVTVAGRSLGGEISKHSQLGRERCAYFFWQGRDSTINEKGACALMTVELDEERGPHVRVIQGQEPPSFLNLFKGGMAIHLGKRDGGLVPISWRMFVVRGDFENEAHLLEIECCAESLRSRGVYVLLHPETGVIRLWLGAKAQSHLVDAARAAVSLLQERRPLEFGFRIGVPVICKDEAEGSESQEFWNIFGKKTGTPYLSLILDSKSFDFTPRLFHMTSISGVFSASEISCSFFSRDRSCAFPFLQHDIYKTEQPALFLLDNDSEVYLWQGWWPEGNEDNDNTATGSAHLRFNSERRLAMETVQEYCKCKNSPNLKPSYSIWAGLEPLEFQNLFPVWKRREDIAEINKKDGKKDCEKRPVDEVLNLLKRSRYTFSELQERPLPEGVDPAILESYLCSEEFQSLLKMSKKEFYALPSWKQSNIKKAAGLYY